MITKAEYERLHGIDTSTVYAEIKKAVDTKSRNVYDMSIPIVAFALYQIQLNPEKDYSDMESLFMEYFSEEMGDFTPYYTAYHMLMWDCEEEEDGPWPYILNLKDKFSLDELAACALFGDKSTYLNDIPFHLEQMMNQVLRVKKKDSVLNLLAGGGSYIVENLLAGENETFANFALDGHAVITYIRLSMIGKQAWLADVMDLPDRKFDKIFCQLYMQEKNAYTNFLNRYEQEGRCEIPDDSSCEWKVASAIMDRLADSGKAVLVCKRNVISNRRDAKAREIFLKNGYIEHVICLPEKLYGDLGKSVLIVLSKGNKEVRFDDFTKECAHGRLKGKKMDILLQKNIDHMKQMLESTDCCVIRKVSEIIGPMNSLNPMNYLVESTPTTCEHNETLESLGLKVRRAAQLTLLDIMSDEETQFRCLMPRNIKDGVVVKPFQYLRNDVGSQLLACEIHPGDILVTKNGAPFKVAVFEDDEPGTVIANGNLYIIRGDYCKADPYYIKAFLESDKGMELINAYSKGSSIPMISLDSLKRIPILYPEADIRQRIAVRCEEISRNIREMHAAIANEKKEISEMFLDVSTK